MFSMCTRDGPPAARGQESVTEQFLTLDDEALVKQCEVDHYRSRGPGGQKRNKTSSAVRLRHRPTGVSVTATEDRSQHVNRKRAIRRLREAIALSVRTRIDPGCYQPSPLLPECVGKEGRFRVGRRDPRYYRAAGEILDVLAACEGRVSIAASHLGISTAGLVKLLRSYAKLWKRVNEIRVEAGVRPLR